MYKKVSHPCSGFSVFFFLKFVVRVLRIGKALFILGTTLLAELKWVLSWPIPKPREPGVVLTKTAIILATKLQVMSRQMYRILMVKLSELI